MGPQRLYFILVGISFYYYPVISEVETRIVGGSDALIEDFPYQAALTITNGSKQYFCGCFIISNRHIVSAAHCCELLNRPEDARVLAGSTNRVNGTEILISKVAYHPKYDDPAFDNDVCVLTSRDEIIFTKYIQPIKLAPPNRKVKSGSEVNVTGWGLEDGSSDELPSNLQVATTNVVPQLFCSLEYLFYVTENMVCAGKFLLGRIFQNEGTCNGDSGGPCVQDCTPCCKCVVGITSWGASGCVGSSVFARISSPAIGNFICNQTGLCPDIFCSPNC